MYQNVLKCIVFRTTHFFSCTVVSLYIITHHFSCRNNVSIMNYSDYSETSGTIPMYVERTLEMF